MKHLALFFLLILLAPVNLFAENSDIKSIDEIQHLLDYAENSKLIFIRNGAEYGSLKAAKHLKDKYLYYKTNITNAEDFISKIATASIVGGQAYMVILADGKVEPLSNWLTSELESYRKIRK